MKITILLLLFVSTFCVSAQNKVREGNFERGVGSWDTIVVDSSFNEAEKPTALANFTGVSPGLKDSQGALFVEVIQPGKYNWYISASNRLSLQTKTSYEITFRAKASVNRNISIALYSDLNSDQPFYSQTIEITTDEKEYGPFKIYYEETPISPGIKLFFGGEEGNVTIDDVYIKPVPTIIEIETSNSIDDIIGDITLPHEGLPHGVWDVYDWGKAPRKGSTNPPDHWTAAIAWGQLYEWNEGNPAKNTRVQIRDLAMYYLSKTDLEWHKLQSSVLVDGAAYVEDFVDDINKPADKRNEPDGSISVTAGDGYNFHFWPSSGRVEIPKGDVLGCFVTVNARLILDDPNGVDDLDSARYLMGVGGDWWESMDAVWDNWQTNWDMGIGRFRFVSKEWQGFNLITLTPSETERFPPPLPYVTAINENSIVSQKGSLNLNNYPNPFNTNTTIEYSLQNNSKVVLEVFNVEGKRLTKLVDEFQLAGDYKITFNGAALDSGMYYYSVKTDSFSETKKMMLVR